MFKAFNIVFVLVLLAVPVYLNKIKQPTVEISASPNSDFGSLRTIANGLLWRNQLRHHMYEPNGAEIYHDILDAYNRRVVEKVGAAGGWHDTHPLWQKRYILRFGNELNTGRHGLKINVGVNARVLWLRALADREITVRVQAWDSMGDPVEYYAMGLRRLNEYSPDGGAPDSFHTQHMWFQIPIRTAGPQFVACQKGDCFISGVAWSSNPWNHARQSALGFREPAVNGGSHLTVGHWNNDYIGHFLHYGIYHVKVPVVWSGRDKLVYLVEHNNNWLGTMHNRVWVNGKETERFRTTYMNAFATHFNSKIYDRYIAIRVPAKRIKPQDRFLDLIVDMTNSDHHIHFREVGSHDYN